MKRREFLQAGILSTLAGSFYSPNIWGAAPVNNIQKFRGKVKNIIFMVSDGMSIGTLTMADLLLQRKENRISNWIRLYKENKAGRALMDTASANSLVTDSAAASSAWGGGIRVNNGALNYNADGTSNIPILQKFKKAGKSTGCITTVPITHATPAGFCVSTKSRNSQDEIASLYKELRFDVMMGGGLEFFNGTKRKDGIDILLEFRKLGYQVALTKEEMDKAIYGKPLLGVFYEDGLPYALDQQSDPNLIEKVPTLASMTKKAIDLLSKNPEGFVLQVEGGKIDWGAHANDPGAMIYDQVAFDEAIGVAVEFAEKSKDTLIIITTDHGNSNPGLVSSIAVNDKFDRLLQFKHTNEWVLKGINKDFTIAQVIERIHKAQNIIITEKEAISILDDYISTDNGGLYNTDNLPFRKFAQIQQNYTSIGWTGMEHTADFVELAMLGPGSEALAPFIKNSDLHNFMLEVTGVTTKIK